MPLTFEKTEKLNRVREIFSERLRHSNCLHVESYVRQIPKPLQWSVKTVNSLRSTESNLGQQHPGFYQE